MKILYLHQYFNTPEMSGGTRSYEMARRLVQWGHEVNMITTDRQASESSLWRESEEAGIRVHWTSVPYSNKMHYRERMKAFGAYAQRAGKKAVELGGDIVFATSTPLTVAIPAVSASKTLKVPMVFEIRDLWPEVPIAMGVLKNPILIAAARWLEKYAYRNSTRIVALAPGMKAHVVSLGYPESNVEVIPNGADLDLFEVPLTEGQRIRDSHEWLGNRPLVVYAGTLGLVNGVDYLVRLAGEMLQLDPEVRFAIIGNGKEEAKCRVLAEDLGVLNRNLFMLGDIPKKEIPAWLSAATVTTSLIIDKKENWVNAVTNKFFDALAAGKPIVSNHWGWQSEIASQVGFGVVLSRLVDLATIELHEKLKNTIWLEEAGKKAKKLAQSTYDRDLLSKHLEKLFFLAQKSYDSSNA